MTSSLRVLLSTALLAGGAASLQAQLARDACADAVRALVRQQAGWENSPSLDSDILRWRAADGTRGYCRVDQRGRVDEVRVERWGSGGDNSYWPGSGGGLTDLTEERGFDRKGDDYNSIPARSLGACQASCRQDARCRAYTYSEVEQRCWLKSRINSKQSDRNMTTGYKIGDSLGSGELFGLTEEWGFDRRGNDYGDFRSASLGACQDSCRRDGRCRAYSYDTRNGVCYLKDRANSGQSREGMVTGYKP